MVAVPSLREEVSAAVALYALHHGLVKGSLFLSVGLSGSRGGASSFVRRAGQVALALAMAAAPFTGGAAAKHAVKEIAHMKGHAATFMPKWHHAKVGSAAHIHQSLFKGDTNIFHDADAKLTMSDTMKSYVAGLIKYAPDMTVFLAPYVNSYKRFAKGTFAPTKIAWSIDNRTAGYRLCGDGTAAVRIECRIGGSDFNPYLALAAQLAAGLAGIEEVLPLADPVTGDLYESRDAPDMPASLRAATECLRGSAMLKSALGQDVVAHYVRCAEWEQEEFDRVVTDWEIARGFERA